MTITTVAVVFVWARENFWRDRPVGDLPIQCPNISDALRERLVVLGLNAVLRRESKQSGVLLGGPDHAATSFLGAITNGISASIACGCVAINGTPDCKLRLCVKCRCIGLVWPN